MELWKEEETGAFNSWNDTLELGRRNDGSFSLRLSRCGIDERFECTLYRSRPFRTARRLLDELQRGVVDGAGGQCRNFTQGDVFKMTRAE